MSTDENLSECAEGGEFFGENMRNYGENIFVVFILLSNLSLLYCFNNIKCLSTACTDMLKEFFVRFLLAKFKFTQYFRESCKPLHPLLV